MVGKIFGGITLTALLYGLLSGRGAALGEAALSGASAAVELTLTLAGVMCLWGGVMAVLRDVGAIGRVARLLRPGLSIVFPDSLKGDGADGTLADDLAGNFGANLLGLGNAATPLALRALEKMAARSPVRETATDDMITLAVLNTAPFSLVPTTLIALRSAAGCAEPFAVVLPVWICSGATFAAALLLTALCRRLFPLREGGGESGVRRRRGAPA